MEVKTVIFLHGFLGLPSDWDQIILGCQFPRGSRIYQLDIFQEQSLLPNQSLEQWGKSFIHWLDRNKVNQPCILVGYSMGGRLALHGLLAQPERFAKLILVATNPSYAQNAAPEIRKQRIVDDQSWAKQFREEDWATVLEKWNSQKIFAGGQEEPLRLEKNYSRETLALVLENWSLAKQRDMRPVVEQYVSYLHWIVGERDVKYRTDAEELKRLTPDLNMSIVSGASHRVLFDQPNELVKLIRSNL